MAPLPLRFVEVNRPNQTQREKELVTSSIRAHNAKVLHAKRGLGNQVPVESLPPSIKRFTSRFRINPRSVGEDSTAVRYNKVSKPQRSLVNEEDTEADQSRQRLFVLLYQQWKESIWTPFSGNVPKHIAICMHSLFRLDRADLFSNRPANDRTDYTTSIWCIPCSRYSQLRVLTMDDKAHHIWVSRRGSWIAALIRQAGLTRMHPNPRMSLS